MSRRVRAEDYSKIEKMPWSVDGAKVVITPIGWLATSSIVLRPLILPTSFSTWLLICFTGISPTESTGALAPSCTIFDECAFQNLSQLWLTDCKVSEVTEAGQSILMPQISDLPQGLVDKIIAESLSVTSITDMVIEVFPTYRVLRFFQETTMRMLESISSQWERVLLPQNTDMLIFQSLHRPKSHWAQDKDITLIRYRFHRAREVRGQAIA